MPEVIPVHVPRENVNDDSVRLLHWRLKKGEPVRQGQVVADLETSKATFELHSPADGVLDYTLAEGQEVAVGGVLCHVLGEGATAPSAMAARGAIAPGPMREGEAPAEPRVSSGPRLGGSLALPESGQSTGNGEPPRNGNRPAPRGSRISPLARRMIGQRGLDAADFEHKGLIRASDVLAALGESSPSPGTPVEASGIGDRPRAGSDGACRGDGSSRTDRANPLPNPPPEYRGRGQENHAPAAPPPVPAAGVAFKAEPLPRAKRIEAKYLSSGLRHTLPSVVTVACPTRGLRAAAAAHSAGTTGGTNTTAVILFEAARLLRKYPAFNAFFADGNANTYEQVNIGFALDGGRGLKVPVIRDADQKSIQQITSQMQDLVVAYLDETLPVESLAGGTFTVTDLSGEGVFSFHPLINQGQSAILGVGAEFFPPGTSVGMFNLILAFDHQLAEGRAAARFLGDLRERLGSYESALAPSASAASAEPACSQCLTPLSELRRNEHHLLQVITATGVVAPVCSACVSGWR